MTEKTTQPDELGPVEALNTINRTSKTASLSETSPLFPFSRSASLGSAHLHSTVPLPDGIVIGGPWPHTNVSWPGGKSRGATKPEYDLFQALESAHAEIERLRAQMPSAALCITHLHNYIDHTQRTLSEALSASENAKRSGPAAQDSAA